MNRTDNDARLAEVKEQIRNLTRREPVSNDLKYLERRLADLKARKKSGESVRRSLSPSTNFSVSMPIDAVEAMHKLVDKEKRGVSPLIRRALGEYARTHGYSEIADVLLGEED